VLRPATKSLADAKACMDQIELKPDKAVKAAEKAIKKLPNHGLAHYCLYLLALKQKQPAAEATKHLELAVKGDPLSIPVWRLLAVAYRDANDTTNALAAAKQLLRLAPGDQELREGLFRYLLQSGQTKAALEIADEGLQVDSTNAELYDLKSNACLVLQDFSCAAEALERVYTIDSTKVDTLYFAKWLAVASAGTTVDTAQLLTWSRIGARKFPDNVTILRNLHRAYILTGEVDSSLATAQRLIALDTTAVRPALAAVRVLATSNRVSEVSPYVDFVKRYGRQQQKNQLAGILVVVALSHIQGDSAAGRAPDWPGAAELARGVIELADSTSQPFHYGNFVLGAALFQQGNALDPETERQKSCEMAHQEQQLMADAKQALSKVQLDQYKNATTQYLGYIDRFAPRITAMLKSYCR
jgi:tetratricopeptide (TPR) repeat protein